MGLPAVKKVRNAAFTISLSFEVCILPRVSVIIPTYNDMATLGQTVAFVLNQDADIEVIVVNDGGHPPHDYLCHADPRLRIIDLPQNGGVSRARNTGFEQASGEFVHFLDADDLVAPDMLGLAVDALSDRSADVLFVGKIDVDGSDIGETFIFPAFPRTGMVRRLSNARFFDQIRTQTGAFIPSATVFRKKALEELLGSQPWNNDLRCCEDTLLFMRIGVQADVLTCSDTFVIYRRRPGSASRNDNAVLQGRLTAMDAFLATRPKSIAAVSCGRKMRQNAARRIARMLKENGHGRQAIAVLCDDLYCRPSLKTAANLLMTIAWIALHRMRLGQ
jgi:GT2 family glycosyltransferase